MLCKVKDFENMIACINGHDDKHKTYLFKKSDQTYYIIISKTDYSSVAEYIDNDEHLMCSLMSICIDGIYATSYLVNSARIIIINEQEECPGQCIINLEDVDRNKISMTFSDKITKIEEVKEDIEIL